MHRSPARHAVEADRRACVTWHAGGRAGWPVAGRSLAYGSGERIPIGNAMARTVFLGLGSNLGDRKATLDRAQDELRDAGLAVQQVSGYRETEPVGGPPGQGRYLNAVARVECSLAALDLLARLQAIEAKLGRV